MIIIISLFLLLSAVNLGTSKSTLDNDSTSEMDYLFDNSVIDNAQEQQILQNINRLDGFFTENQGQMGNDFVRYYIQGKGVWFLDDGVVFEIQELFAQTEVQRDPFDRIGPEFEPEKPTPRKSVVLKLNFEGCNEIKPKGVGLLPHRSNFFYGNDSSKWCTNVPNYQELIYENIYDNIDLRYYSSDKGLKYDFIIYPGGEPEDIRMRYEGAQDVSIESSGELNIRTNVGKIVDTELFIYQLSENSEIKINGKFKRLASMTYGFEIIEKYDNNNAIIIDPLVYSTYIGGNNEDKGRSIAIDTSGNAYVTGYTYSANFPKTPTANDTTYNGNGDGFVLKLNPIGAALIYSTFIGGNSEDSGRSIAIDTSGNAYMTGYTFSANFPTTPGANDTTFNGMLDISMLKLNRTGAALIYSTFIGGSDDDHSRGMAIDSSGNAYVTGTTDSADFPTTPGANDTTFNGIQDGFVVKLNQSGALLIYSTYIGGNDYEYGESISIDTNGNAYVTGYTDSANFPTTPGANDITFNGMGDVFVLKLNPIGATLLYSTFIGGSGNDYGSSIAIDINGNAYVTGPAGSVNFPTTLGVNDTTYNGNGDVFVLKLNPIGATLLYSTFIGGSGDDYGSSIAIDTNGNAYVTGRTLSANFPTTSGANDTTYNIGEYDGFLFKLNPIGVTLLYSTFIGGNDEDSSWGIAIDTTSNAYVTGGTISSDFPNTTGAFDMTFNGDDDVFILKLHINNLPYVLDLKISEPTVLRTNPMSLYSNATDFEDLEQNLTPVFEYRDPNEQLWNNIYFSSPQYQNSRWEVSFTPPKNATLGLYDFRVRFNDTGQSFSNWAFLNDSLLVLNNIPAINDIILSNNSALLVDSISIGVNASDIEELEENLTIELEYRDPSETSWDKTYLSAPTYNNGRWECSFNIPFDALFGYYDFRARCNDSDGNYSAWLFLNDLLLVYNTGPKVINAGLSEISIYRTESVFIFINGTDYETPENMLSFYVQYKSQSEDEWGNLTGYYLNNRWEVSFTTNIESILGDYDFRVKFEDNESVSSGWIYVNDSLEVLNNLPMISEDLDNISVGIQPLLFDLTPYESDIEDTDENLIWSIEPQIYSYIESIGIIDTVNDTLKITPKEDVIGTEDIELILTDKDSRTVVKSDITIIINSSIIESIPMVTLISPPDKTTIDTLTPTLNWELDYSGSEIITYNVVLDENPDPQTPIKTGLTTTEYTLENELMDGKTYYWKVEPNNGLCLSGSFSFMIDLGFEPIYKVNLTTNKNSIIIERGNSESISLTITNEGNIEDDFTISFESTDFTSANIQFSKSFITLNKGDSDTITVTITIPENMEPGEYTIKFIVESNDDPKESSLTITVKNGDEPEDGEEDNTLLYAGIGIIVIVLIVILILLFIFLKKKKGKEEEPPVEEPQPPPPEEVPPEAPPEQPPTPEIPPEQPSVPETPPEQTPTPEVTPQVVPQVEPAPEQAPMPQVEEQPQPKPQVEQPVPKIKTEPTIEENNA